MYDPVPDTVPLAVGKAVAVIMMGPCVNRASSVLLDVAVKVYVAFVLTRVPPSYQPSKVQPVFAVALTVTEALCWNVPPPDTPPPLGGEPTTVIMCVCG